MNHAVRLCLLVLIMLQSSVVQGQTLPPSASLAIAHVNVINTEDGSIQRNMAVLIRNGRIVSVEGAGGSIPGEVQQIDGRGKFLIPGLWDMHVHLSWTTASALPVLVANGVTGVRDAGSDLTEIDDWRTKIAAGLLIGPRIVRAGPILNGQSFNRYQLVTETADQARGIVRALKQVGVDFIKIHRRVPRDAYFTIMDEAKKQGLAVVGHIPMTVRPEEASDAGQLIEHEETLFEGTFSADLTPAERPGALRRFYAEVADTLFARFVRNQTPVTSTLVAWQETVAWVDHGLSDPRLRYVARSQIEALKRMPPLSAEEQAGVKQTFAELKEALRRLNRSGVMLLAGSDVAGPRIPGFSLHDELALMVDAGLTPLQALRSATLNPAKIFKRDNDFGSITPGRLADLVLLDANPLDDIRNTQRIAAVVMGGKLLLRPDLDALLRTGEEMASKN